MTSYATSIRVSWTAPEPESKIMVRGYTLGYGKGIADVYMEVLGPDVNVFTIESLGNILLSLILKYENNKMWYDFQLLDYPPDDD